MDIREIEINKLKPASYNPRKKLMKEDEEYQRIKDSINNFGYVDPIIINKDYTIIGGHQRHQVLKDEGYKKIHCVIVDIDKNQEKALNIALNKISGFWDNDKLTELLKELNEMNIGHMTGFSQDEIDNYLKDVDIDAFFDAEENAPKEPPLEERECPECSCLINIKNWKVVE